MVILKDKQLAPMLWRSGRVFSVTPGTDGVVRVVHVRTAKGEFVQPVVKLVLLPIE